MLGGGGGGGGGGAAAIQFAILFCALSFFLCNVPSIAFSKLKFEAFYIPFILHMLLFIMLIFPKDTFE